MLHQLVATTHGLLTAFPLVRCAAVFASDAASEHLAAMARRDRTQRAAELAHAEGFLREAMRQEHGIVIADAASREAIAQRLQAADLPSAMLGIPLRLGSEVLGALYLDS